ncbi:QueT transporter family protein [Sporolactobacillus sp. Y61]|jgi:uncharacterized membrane protein|uniref:QueT transporter family protein n=1 Tax=Sporolactobacillus sp. Y61 TaxID=3160863 RepID=A0AAU8IE91_9BACL|nr:QueT transporter family protein [Sporolactobacillus sp. THM19-2]RYL93238.1 QueT transporter family protein [Sporolactobacillus sp. THM19-2]
MKIRFIAINALVAAVYIVLTFAVQPVAFYALQLRLPEMLNHLIAFNKKYFIGIVVGVFMANLFFSPLLPYDLIFGTGQSVVALLISILLISRVKNVVARMLINTAVFSVTMCIIAWELTLAGVTENVPFLLNWLTLAAGEAIVMLVGTAVFYAVNKRLHFEKQI